MQLPVVYVTRFLDSLIQEYGVYLYMGLVFLSEFVIVWLLVRPRKRPVHDFAVVILPLGQPPKREEEPPPLLFQDTPEF